MLQVSTGLLVVFVGTRAAFVIFVLTDRFEARGEIV
jgi:hypothetical protein